MTSKRREQKRESSKIYYLRHKQYYNEYAVKWYKAHKELMEARRRQRHERNKQRAIEHLGGKCILCGYSGHIAAMEFHHVDPSVKKFRLALHLSASWPWERLLTEIDKCVLLCGNCHAIVEWEKKRGNDILNKTGELK